MTKSPAPTDSAKVEDTGEPVAWRTELFRSTNDMVRVTLPKPILMARCENRAFLVAGFESPEECKAFIYAINTAPAANDRAITDEQILDLSLRFIPNDDRRARDSQIIDFVHAVLAAVPPKPPLPSAQRVAVDFYVINPHCAQTDFEQRLVDAAPRLPNTTPSTQAVGEPTGWKLVPIEPTHEMLVAAAQAEYDGDWQCKQENRYQAMLAAAPALPVPVACPECGGSGWTWKCTCTPMWTGFALSTAPTTGSAPVGELVAMLKRAKHALKNHGFSVLCGEIDELLAKHKESK